MNRTLVHHQCEGDVIADSKAIGFLRCSAQCSGLYGDCSKRVGLYAAGSQVVKLIQYPRMAVEFERGAGRGVCQTLFGPLRRHESVRESRRIHGFGSQGICQSVSGYSAVSRYNPLKLCVKKTELS